MATKRNAPKKRIDSAAAAAAEITRITPRLNRLRKQFHSLVLGNPNYFGNMPDLGFKPVEILKGNTTYEQLTCIGLNPDANRLEAVVDIKQPSGYITDPCGTGSTEYVRFFVLRSDGWHDLGDTSFTAYDMPASPRPLSYSVSITMDELNRYCKIENIVTVRGILSWSWEPPAGDPNWTPPWGNVVDVRVQVAPWYLYKIPLAQLIKDEQIAIKPDLLANLNLEQTLQAEPPKQYSYAQLKEMYADKGVPGHRFGFMAAQQLLKEPLTSFIMPSPLVKGKKAAAAELPVSPLSSIALGPELGAILAAIAAQKGDTTFEQLTCVGYNPATRMLGGVISIKRSSGYLSDLCHAGSTEYVGFWVFYDGAWHGLGTAQVTVHDLEAVDAGGPVEYAVFRGANLPEYLCGDVTGLPLRAILSWETPPADPNFDPTWGNVVDTHIQPLIGDAGVGDQRVRLMRINSVSVQGISDITGLANPTGVAEDCNTAVYGNPINDAPFGGYIYIEGDFAQKIDVFDPNTGDVLPGTHPLLYQVFVTGPTLPTTQLINSFGIGVLPADAAVPITKTQAIQSNGVADTYVYMEGTLQVVNPRTLAVWPAGGLDEGLYQIEVIGYMWNGVSYVALTPQTKNVYVYNGYPHTELVAGGGTINIQRPEVHLQITSPSGDCGDVEVGDEITGTFSVTDHFFGELSIGVVQITVGGVPQPINPVSVFDPGPAVVLQPNPVIFEDTAQADTHGMSGTWTLNTAGMTPCGYTVVLSSWDRALVGNSCSGHYNQIGVGFCLRAKTNT